MRFVPFFIFVGLWAAFWISVLYVAWHFIAKYW